MESSDAEKEANLFQIELETSDIKKIDLVVAVGNMKNTFKKIVFAGAISWFDY